MTYTQYFSSSSSSSSSSLGHGGSMTQNGRSSLSLFYPYPFLSNGEIITRTWIGICRTAG